MYFLVEKDEQGEEINRVNLDTDASLTKAKLVQILKLVHDNPLKYQVLVDKDAPPQLEVLMLRRAERDGDQRGGAVFLEGQLRVAMDVTAQADEFTGPGLQRVQQIGHERLTAAAG